MPVKVNNRDDMVRFSKSYGVNLTDHVQNVLGEQLNLSRALQTYPGSVLLADMQELWHAKFRKIVEMSADEEEKLEFKIIHALLCKWATRIAKVAEMDARDGGS